MSRCYACLGRLRWFGLLVSLVLMLGCAGPSLKPTPVAAPDHWRLSGRFGAKNDQNAWNGNLAWSQQNDVYDIVLSAPLGQGAVALRGDARSSELELAPDRIFSDGSAERLLLDHTGWYIPFDNLRFWLTGHPVPGMGAAESEFDDQGRLKRLHQDQWVVDFKRYVRVDGIDLPDKIFLIHPTFEVRFVVDRWELPG